MQYQESSTIQNDGSCRFLYESYIAIKENIEFTAVVVQGFGNW